MAIVPGIQIKDAFLEYDHHLLFQGLNLTIPAAKWTCLLAPSGAGKTSLLRFIAGLQPSANSLHPVVATDGQTLEGRIAYLAQNEQPLPWLTALENVVIGMALRGEKISATASQQAASLLSRVGLKKHVHSLPHMLSGGMKQRVLLARTLFEDKPVILMDEPFAALDVITRTHIGELAAELLKDRTVVLVTHDPLEALRFGHRIYVMSGKPAEIKTEINLSDNPPRELTNHHLLSRHAEILETLSHAKEVMEC
ncbi:MAG: ABC transporter ATP-binding protein [Gammaproteobacteria bacterium]|nr:ABC transporter ATP-binding protein [Gammaproteobacteria bacterium]